MSCVHEFSLRMLHRMHTMVSNHASPASKLCSQDMRIACSARMCGRPAAAPYPGLRPSASKLCSQDMRIACSARMCGRPAAAPFPRQAPAGGRATCFTVQVSCFERGENNDEKCLATMSDHAQNWRSPITLRSKRFLL